MTGLIIFESQRYLVVVSFWEIISREKMVKWREMLIVDQFQRQGHLQKKSRKTVRLLKIEQRITRIPLLQDNSMQFE